MEKGISLTALMVTLLLTLTMVTPGAYALNSQNNKAYNYCGYAIPASNQITVYLDKNSSTVENYPVVEQFKVEANGSPVDIIDFSYATGDYCSGIDDSALHKGTAVTLTLGDELEDDTDYMVCVSNTVYANNGSNIGSYFKMKDAEFALKTEASTGTVVVTPRIDNGDTGIPWESNIGFTIERPVDTTTAASILTNMRLQKKVNDVYTDVILDPTINSSAFTGAEGYTARKNIANNYFFFPMTGNGNTTISYNLSSGEYRLVVPTFTIGNDTFSTTNVDFTTTTGDVPGKLETAPTVEQGTASDNQINISWSAGTTSPIASEYNVYVSEDKYWNFVKKNSSPLNTTGTTITGLDNAKTYFVRITPVNGYGEGGFSLVNGTAVAP